MQQITGRAADYGGAGASACALEAWINPRIAAIFTRMVNTCWPLFQWGLFLTIAAALGVGGYYYIRLDDEICRQVEQRLAAHYPNLSVHVGRARYDQDHGIAIYDVSFTAPNDTDGSPIASIDEMYLAGKFGAAELISGELPLERITLQQAHLRVIREGDGQWNVAALVPLPRFGGECPLVTIEDATVVFEDAACPQATPLNVRDVDLTLTRLEQSAEAGSTPRYRVSGTVTGLPVRELSCEGEFGTADGAFNLAVKMRGLEATPELLDSFPLLEREHLHGAEISGRADADLYVTRLSALGELNWTAEIKIDRGRLAHSRLSEPFTDVMLDARADCEGLKIDNLTGKWGPATLAIACQRAGWSASAPLGLSAKAVGLPLDDRVKSVLPAACQRAWQRFQPGGNIDAEFRTTFDGENWRPQFSAECRDLSLTDRDRFPYLLEEGTGTIQYVPAIGSEADRFAMDITALGAGRPVRIVAELSHLAPAEPEGPTTAIGVAVNAAGHGDTRSAGYRGIHSQDISGPNLVHPVGWVDIAGTDIPLHEQLMAALPDTVEPFVRSLRGQGAVDFHFRAEWNDRAQPRANVTQDIVLKDCLIQYAKFPYALHHVRGVISERNRIWTLHNLEGCGASQSTVVTCNGTSTRRGDDSLVDLVFDAANVPLDETLKAALPATGQQAWDELRPQGRVDFSAHVLHETGQEKPVIEIQLQPRERSVSIEPRRFPYRLEQVQGAARFQAGRVDLSNLSGRHDRANYSASAGTWQAAPDGGWRLELQGINIDRLTPRRDRDLLAALPPALQTIVERLQPTGNFAVHNSAVGLAGGAQTSRMAAAWDVRLLCHQAAFQGAFSPHGVTGEIRLLGRNDLPTPYAAGELDLDSLVWKDIQFTNVRGPIWIDSLYCLFGELAAQRQGQPPRRLTGDAYGGSLAANAVLQHGPDPRYELDVALGGVNLARFSSERLGGSGGLSGTVSGKLTLAGTGRSPQTLSGGGELHVVEGNIYELPFLMSLLKVLKNRTPTSTAFDQCDMRFAIQGEHIQFQQLNLLGDALSLYGNGETNFNRDLNLVFYTLIGPADLPIPLLKNLAGQVSQQGMQLKVVGKWDNPEVQRKALPALNDAFQQIQAEIQAGAATLTPSTAARETFAPPR
ncbi:MAG TPA: AsmA-like C-terminal region-containing protein [Lacipirellulaceae bacterium]|nr:AsmA-like C-terminal region-containing protein [Lacipirellulaceae bacterium]